MCQSHDEPRPGQTEPEFGTSESVSKSDSESAGTLELLLRVGVTRISLLRECGPVGHWKPGSCPALFELVARAEPGPDSDRQPVPAILDASAGPGHAAPQSFRITK